MRFGHESMKSRSSVRWAVLGAIAALGGCGGGSKGLDEPPVAKISGPTEAHIGERVLLSGVASTTPNGGTLTYAWSIESRPAGSAATLARSDLPNVGFNVDARGTYVIRLDVADAVRASVPVTWMVVVKNGAPVAAAGADVQVRAAGVVNLDGSGSSDPEGDALTYQWTLVSTPDGSGASLARSDTAQPSLTVDVLGPYSVQLVVHDGTTASEPDTVQVLFSLDNRPPVAGTGPDRNVNVFDMVTLDGSSSSDPDGDPLTFRWSIDGRPNGSGAVLTDSTSAQARFIPDVEGQYDIILEVSDGQATDQKLLYLVAIVNPVGLGRFDPDEAYVFGTIAEGAAGLDVFCHPETPGRFSGGFPSSNYKHWIHPTDGRLLYLDGNNDVIREFVPDPIPWDPERQFWSYPQDAEANDPVLATNQCDAASNNWPTGLRVLATGGYHYACQRLGWFDDADNPVTACSTRPNDSIQASSEDGAFYCRQGAVYVNGNEIVINPNPRFFVVRSKPGGGFWGLLRSTTDNLRFERWTIDVTGQVTLDGTYPAPVDFQYINADVPRWGNIDRAGNMYRWGHIPSQMVSEDAIIRFSADFTTSTVVYNEASPQTHCRLHAFSFVTSP